MNWLKWICVALAVLLVVGIGAVAYGSWHWKQVTKDILTRLETARVPSQLLASTSTLHPRYNERVLEGLPTPVQRYFRKVLKDGQPIIAAASIEQAGMFNMSETTEQWKPFTAKQRVITQRPGFDWDARIMMFPYVAVHIHDAYFAGHGMLRGAVLGLIPVVNMPDSPELQQGEFMRYFMEALWYPTALLPSQDVRWEAIDNQSALASYTDGAITLTLTFRFQEDGLIEFARAESRGRLVNGISSGAPWQGRFWNYAIRDGMTVPLEGEVAWVMKDGVKPYYRGKVTSLLFEYMSPR
jgi:hypothetical protein